MTNKSVLFGARRAEGTDLGAQNSISRLPARRGFLLIPVAVALTWLALSPAARAVTPAPDGGYPGLNTAEGDFALLSLTTGCCNTAIGNFALSKTTTGYSNTAIGTNALLNNTTGTNNTANGHTALYFNTTGVNNTANGSGALAGNTTGNSNTATGFEALHRNTIGTRNTATGVNALLLNTTGSYNTANGSDALQRNTTGANNTATGVNALLNNTTGSYNTANGSDALQRNTTGFSNTANGIDALLGNTTGSANTANGSSALFNNTTGTGNIALGKAAGADLTTGDNNIAIGNPGVAGESGTIRIGTNGTHTLTNIAGIRGATVASGVGVIVGTGGRLGTVTSSARFKDQIKPMDRASEAILALKPVTFRYKHALDPEGIPQFGLVAEQVEKVNPDLVARDEQGKVNTVRYEAVNAMLLNEFLKEHRKVQELEAALARQRKDFQSTVARQQKEIKALAASLKEQALQIRKVSGQREASKPAPQTAAGG